MPAQHARDHQNGKRSHKKNGNQRARPKHRFGDHPKRARKPKNAAACDGQVDLLAEQPGTEHCGKDAKGELLHAVIAGVSGWSDSTPGSRPRFGGVSFFRVASLSLAHARVSVSTCPLA